MGTVMLSISMNGLSTNTRSELMKFACNTELGIIIKSEQVQHTIQKEMDDLQVWNSQNKTKFKNMKYEVTQ